MIKCCSHTGYRSAREILDSTDRPVIFSHSNPSGAPRPSAKHPRRPDQGLRRDRRRRRHQRRRALPRHRAADRRSDRAEHRLRRAARRRRTCGPRPRLHVQELGARRARARRPGDLAARMGLRARHGLRAARSHSGDRGAASHASAIRLQAFAESSGRICCASRTRSGSNPPGPPAAGSCGGKRPESTLSLRPECGTGHSAGPEYRLASQLGPGPLRLHMSTRKPAKRGGLRGEFASTTCRRSRTSWT